MAKYSVGRSDQNTITVDDQTVSRQHAELETKRGGKFILRDLGSTYGTKILRDGDWIDVIEVEVTADTDVVLGEYQTTVGALAEQAKGAKAQPAAAAPAAAAAPVAAQGAAAAGAAGGGGPKKDRTTMWILIGGGILLLVVVIAAVLILVLEDDGQQSAVGRSSSKSSSSSSSGSGPGARFRDAMVADCVRRGQYNRSQCQCAARVIVGNLSAEELRFMNRMVRARTDAAERAKIMQEFGQQRAVQISLKFAGVMKKVETECGFTLRRQRQ